MIKLEATIGPSGKTIDVRFEYDPYLVFTIKTIPGARFVNAAKGGPLWRLPLELSIGKDLRKAFGKAFVPDLALKKWAMRKAETRTKLREIAHAENVELIVLPDALPELYRALHVGPIGKAMPEEELEETFSSKEASYQTADVAFMAHAEFAINSNQPGLGKTLEAIATPFEMGIENGPKLVIAPVTSLEATWVTELSRWQYQDIILCSGGKERRQEAIDAALEYVKDGEPFWFVVNPATVQYQQIKELDPVSGEPTGKRQLWLKHPEIHEIDWNYIVLDEFHQFGLGNPDTLTARGLFELKAQKKVAMSGTPIQGKPIKLFGVLKFGHPEQYTSRWAFAEQWLVIDSNHWGKKIGDVRKEREDEFYEFLGQCMIRREKATVLPWLPPKDHIDLWVSMGPKQSKQYEAFAADAEIRIDELQLTANGILAEYTRLKQFAIAVQRIEPVDDPPYAKPFPTEESCKLDALEELLLEKGILGDNVDENAQALIFSQFTQVVNMVEQWLKNKHVRTMKITGEVTGRKRGEAQAIFQSEKVDRPQVGILNTTAGGVSITLDNADTVIFLDETWVPDHQEQAEDRAHRGSKIHQVTCYYIRTKGTIEEYIHRRVTEKDNINKRILDFRGEGLRATGD